MKRYIITAYTLCVSIISIIAGSIITHSTDALRIRNLEDGINEKDSLIQQLRDNIQVKDSVLDRYYMLFTPYTTGEV